MKDVLFNFCFFFLFSNFWFYEAAPTTTLSPYAKEKNKISVDLLGIQRPRQVLTNWLANERVDRKLKMEQLYENIGKLKEELENMKKIALKLFVIPYFCQKFELYGEHWGRNNLELEDFDPDDLTGTDVAKHDLNRQTRASYRANAKKWYDILCNSAHPLAVKFTNSLEKKYPNVPLSILAKDLGLAIALLNNAKHGVAANLLDPDAMELLQTDSAIEALSEWGSLSDPIMLGVIYEFEKVTSCRRWKPE